MKKIIITTMFLLSVFFNKAQEINYDHTIHCTPSIEKCLENLEKLKDFIEYDYSMSNDIPKYVYNEYNLVIDYTMLSLKMILKDEGQCIESEVVEEINFRD